MSDLQQKKLHQLYLFIKSNGFDLSVENIAAGINVTPKTIFNRYQNKENMETMVLQYWCNLVWNKFQEKQKQCNNAIEKLLILSSDIKRSAVEDQILFTKARYALNNWDNNFKANFLANVQNIINEGIAQGLFKEEHQKSNFVKFMLHNFSTLFLSPCFKEDYFQYIFIPLLTDYGKVIFNEINLESFIN